MNSELLQILKEFSWEVRKGNITSVLLSYCKKDGTVDLHSFGDFQSEIVKTVNSEMEGKK